jgi:hypothetical protein
VRRRQEACDDTSSCRAIARVTRADDRADRLQRLLTDVGDDRHTIERLCRGCIDHLSMSGVGVSVVASSGDRGFVFATDEVSARIEELQVSLGEGPCVDAWTSRLPVMEPDLARVSGGRWMAFAPAACAAGAAAVVSLPLHVGLTRLGAMDIYRDTRGGLSDADLRDALRLSGALTQVLLRNQPYGLEPEPVPAEVGQRFGIEVYQASGMVMVQVDVDAAEAMARLQAHAYAVDRPLPDVARDVVARRLRLERD